MPPESDKGMLERGLRILEFVAKADPGTASVVDISQETGLPKSTVYRLVSIERGRGFLDYDERNKTFSLGPKIFELAASHSTTRDLALIAKPEMERLAQLTKETIQLSVLNVDSALFVGKVSSQYAVTIRGDIGQFGPLYATSTGKALLANQPAKLRAAIVDRITFEEWTPNTIGSTKALLAELDLVSRRGYATADEEFDAGVLAIAVPIFDSNSQTAAAICISVPKFRINMATLETWLPDLKETARRIGMMVIR